MLKTNRIPSKKSLCHKKSKTNLKQQYEPSFLKISPDKIFALCALNKIIDNIEKTHAFNKIKKIQLLSQKIITLNNFIEKQQQRIRWKEWFEIVKQLKIQKESSDFYEKPNEIEDIDDISQEIEEKMPLQLLENQSSYIEHLEQYYTEQIEDKINQFLDSNEQNQEEQYIPTIIRVKTEIQEPQFELPSSIKRPCSPIMKKFQGKRQRKVSISKKENNYISGSKKDLKPQSVAIVQKPLVQKQSTTQLLQQDETKLNNAIEFYEKNLKIKSVALLKFAVLLVQQQADQCFLKYNQIMLRKVFDEWQKLMLGDENIKNAILTRNVYIIRNVFFNWYKNVQEQVSEEQKCYKSVEKEFKKV